MSFCFIPVNITDLSGPSFFVLFTIAWSYIKKISCEENKCPNVNLEGKFAAQDGITFYYFPRSPCARRVWLTLIEKRIKCNFVMVNLMVGEQRHPAFLKINAQGKVPAIVVRNHGTIPNCTLYESQSIVEWLEEQFPSTLRLYPTDLENRTTTKMWQYFELVLAEEIWPLSRQQVDGVLWRFLFSRKEFYERGPPSQQSDDIFYKEKVSQIYEGTYMSTQECQRSLIRIMHGFRLLEIALSERKSDFLVGQAFSQADIAAYPRLCKMPQNGIIATEKQRALFPHVMIYFAELRRRSAFQRFAVDDAKIWDSGVYPKFVPQWWGRFIPWWLLIAVGKYRAGVRNFIRVSQASIGEVAISAALQCIDNLALSAIPRLPTAYTVSGQSSPLLPILFLNSSLPLSVAVEICVDLMGFKCTKVYLDVAHLENYCHQYLQFMPFGEVPALLCGEKVVYGPHIIVEYIQARQNDELNNSSHFRSQSDPGADCAQDVNSKDEKGASCSQSNSPHSLPLRFLLDLTPVQRAIARRWFGWARTAWHYQLKHVHHFSIARAHRQIYDSQSDLRAALRKSICAAGSTFPLECRSGADIDPETSLGPYSPAAIAIEELVDVYVNTETATMADMVHYTSELGQRLHYLESELKEVEQQLLVTAPSQNYRQPFLSGAHATYADIFVLTIVELSEAFMQSTIDPQDFPMVSSWREAVLRIGYMRCRKGGGTSVEPISNSIEVVVKGHKGGTGGASMEEHDEIASVDELNDSFEELGNCASIDKCQKTNATPAPITQATTVRQPDTNEDGSIVESYYSVASSYYSTVEDSHSLDNSFSFEAAYWTAAERELRPAESFGSEVPSSLSRSHSLDLNSSPEGTIAAAAAAVNGSTDDYTDDGNSVVLSSKISPLKNVEVHFYYMKGLLQEMVTANAVPS